MTAADLLKNRPDMPWWVELLVASIIGLGAAGDHFLGGKDTTAAVAVIQNQQKADEQRMDTSDKRSDRLEDKVDYLIRLETWAHGQPPQPARR